MPLPKKKRILIIEDEKPIADAEKLILQEQYSVDVALDGDAGLDKIRKTKPDLVVLDLMLPRRGGYDICFHLRQDATLQDIKVLMVTAKNQPIDKEKGVMVGTDGYLTKPFEPQELLQRVTSLLRQ